MFVLHEFMKGRNELDYGTITGLMYMLVEELWGQVFDRPRNQNDVNKTSKLMSAVWRHVRATLQFLS